MQKRVTFVRLLRVKGMKFGVGVDVAGKKWRGFFANRTDSEIRQSGHLGSVGLCLMCRGRVYEGWECLDDKRDACVSCVMPPPPEKIFVLAADTPADVWDAEVTRFYRDPNYAPEGNSCTPSPSDSNKSSNSTISSSDC